VWVALHCTALSTDNCGGIV
jgi:hypothetical protein